MIRLSLLLPLLAAALTSAGQLSVSSSSDTALTAQTIASRLVGFYGGSLNSGSLPQPYWWWESAGALNTLVRYSHYTKDYQYDIPVAAAIAAQAGTSPYFMGPNTLGNDDQLWWGLLCMTAAEFNFNGSRAEWVQYAEDVYDQVRSRWDTSTCNGGLRWQLSPSAQGYDYENGISNGLYFQLAARLGRYTGNSTYTSEASTVWDWVSSVGLIDKTNYNVYDGTSASQGCSQVNHQLYSYNTGAYLYGAAVMLDVTGDSNTWQAR